MTRAQLIGLLSLLFAIPYFLLAPNWTDSGFVWLGGTVILLTISAFGFIFHMRHIHHWSRRKSIAYGVGLFFVLALAFLLLLWRIFLYNMNSI